MIIPLLYNNKTISKGVFAPVCHYKEGSGIVIPNL